MTTKVEEFLTYEEQLTRLSDLSGKAFPNLTEGWIELVGSLSQWWGASDAAITLPDPSLNLSLPFPRDELALAMAKGKASIPSDSKVEEHATRYGIALELLDRPVMTLSGGEKMLVSLSKQGAVAGFADKSIVCSPFFWLDDQNRKYVEAALHDHARTGGNAFLLLLEGESDVGAIVGQDAPVLDTNSQPWTLRVQGVTVNYQETVLPRRSVGKTLRFQSSPTELSLMSPTLLTGRNGVGKTTLAKLLAGIVAETRGSVRAITGGFSGRARLLMQDPLTHLFGLSPRDHLRRVFAYDDNRKEDAFKLYRKLEAQCADVLKERPGTITVGNRDEPASILQAKLALAAERLVTPTPLLIIDEPGWCLSRPIARAFLSAVAQKAHEINTAILAISHQKSWWDAISGSHISMNDTGNVISIEKAVA